MPVVKVVRPFWDLLADRNRRLDEVFEVDEARAEVLVAAGVAVLVDAVGALTGEAEEATPKRKRGRPRKAG